MVVAGSSLLSKLWSFSIVHQLKSKQSQLIYVCFPQLILRSEMLSARRRYHLTAITLADVRLKMTTILKELRIAQLRSKNKQILKYFFLN